MSTSSASANALPSTPALSGGLLWTAGILLAAANFVAVLDMTIANVSVPNISGSLSASTSQGTWVITSYSVAEAITVPLTGWIAARYGAVRVFVAAMIGFGICSALCGLAGSLETLVLFRVFQGLCGGPMLPLSQTLLLRIFPKHQQPQAMALWAVTTLVAPVLGPILGGQLCDNFGWPSIFWVNVPIALICAPVIFGVLRIVETPTVKNRVDGIGLALLILAVGSLQIMLDLGKEYDWFESPVILWLGIVAIIGIAAFLIWELTEDQPIVDLKVFRHRGFTMPMVAISLGFGAYFAGNVITPLWLQSNMGYTATWAGYATGVMGLTAIIAAPVAAILGAKIDPRIIVFVGLIWLAITIFWRGGSTADMAFWQIALLIFITGAGLPLFFLPVTSMALASVEPEEMAGAAGLMSFIRTLSGAFATSIVNTVWEDSATANQSELSGLLNGAQGTINGMVQGGMTHDQAVASLTQIVQGQATMIATDQIFVTSAFLFLIAAAVIWLAPKPTRTVAPGQAH